MPVASRRSAGSHVGSLASLRSLGFDAGHTVVAIRVAALPANLDIPSLSATGVPKLRHRVDHVVRLRRALLAQLREETRRSGAVGVAGVQLVERTLDVEGSTADGRALVEFSATGVTIKAPVRRPSSTCFTTTVGPALLPALLQAGYMAADVLVDGVARLRRSRDVMPDAAVVTQRYNGEIGGQTEMIQAGRRAVVAAMHRQAQRLGAHGVLVGAFETAWSPRHSVVEVSAVGDAVVRTPTRDSTAPTTTLHLS